jgi:hypothetical protein
MTGDVSFRLEVTDARRGTREAATVRSIGGLPARRGEEAPAKPAPAGAEPGPETAPFGLRVERSNGKLLLAWNPQSAPIDEATQATLTIVDGDHKEDVDLDLGSLRSGSSCTLR